jgi:hypothetical protein
LLGLYTGAGLIDSDYAGEILVAIDNFDFEDYVHDPRKAVAQIVFVPYYAEPDAVDAVRVGGFGSTDIDTEISQDLVQQTVLVKKLTIEELVASAAA